MSNLPAEPTLPRAFELAARFAILDEAPNAFMALDRDWRYAYINAAGAHQVGKTPSELIGRVIWEVFPDAVGSIFWHVYHRAMDVGEFVEAEDHYAQLDLWFEVRVYPIEIGIAVHFTDVTIRKRAALALAESQRQLAWAQEIAQTGSYSWDVVNHQLTWSPEMYRILGLPETYLPRFERLHEVVHAEDLPLMHRALEGALAGLAPYDIELRMQRPSGEERIIHTRAEVVRDPVGAPIRVFGVMQDITDRKRMEEDLRTLNEDLERRVRERTAQLESANRELEAFTYSVSHDLKGPLRAIDGYSRLLLDGYSDKLDGEGREFLRTVRTATQRMNQLIDDLLAYALLERRDIQPGPLEPLSLIEPLLAEYSGQIRERGVTVQFAVTCAVVIADGDGLRIALRNLLENALKFTRNTSQPRIEIGARDNGASTVLWVKDNGVGFDMKFHDRIFKIFQRLHRAEDYPGTGVGLAIVSKAMERMGGRAWAESEPGRGAVFYLQIPK